MKVWRTGNKVTDVGEKMKLGGIRVGRTVLESKRFGFGYDRKRFEVR